MVKSEAKHGSRTSVKPKARVQLLDSVANARARGSRDSLVALNEPNPLGGASRQELLAVVNEQLGADPNLEASEAAIAVESLARIVAARMAHSEWANDPKQLAVFMVSDRVRELAQTFSATKEPIIDNGSRSLTGKLWLTGPNFASGYFAPFASAEPGDMFEEVIAKGLGGRPALVFDPNATEAEIRFYPNGLDDEGHVQRFAISSQAFTLSALDAVMKQHHERSIITPDAALPDFNPWKNGTKYIPREHAEAFFQGMLKLVLDVAFGPKCRIAIEVRGTEGRCDLLISSMGINNTWESHAALELKVLRSFTSGASAVSAPARAKAISSGLLQAIAYRNENKAKDGLLCCFDMRSPKHYDGTTCLMAVATKAKRQKIGLRHFRIYGSSEDLRTDKYGSASTAS
jgi:hypothetical protein